MPRSQIMDIMVVVQEAPCGKVGYQDEVRCSARDLRSPNSLYRQ
jgi:hypothetical protein